MFHTINKFLDEPYINFIIKNNGLQGLKEPIFNMLRPLLTVDDNIYISGFSLESKITSGSNTYIQRNKTFKNIQGHTSMYCVMIFLNNCYTGGNVKLYTNNNNIVLHDTIPKKGNCLVFDNNIYYSHDQYDLTTRADRMILKTYIMGTSIRKSRPTSISPTPSGPMVIPTRKLSIKKELSVSPPTSMFELSPVRDRTMSDPEEVYSPLHLANSPLGRLGSHRLTSNSMSELPSVTPVSSPTVNNMLPTSYSDMEKSTIYKRLSKLYKKKI